MTRILRDPLASSVVLFAALTVAGFLAILLGWRIAARTLVVAEQVPALVSGGLGGLAMIILGSGWLDLQLRRQQDIDEEAELDRVVEAAQSLAQALEAGR